MSPSRRTFLQQATAFGLACRAPVALSQMSMPMAPVQPVHPGEAAPVKMLHSLELTPFVDPLPLPAAIHAPRSGKLRVTMRETHAKVHRDLPPTRLWTYSVPLIEARARRPLQIEWINQLPTRHFLPVDFSLHGCGHDIPEVRACVHLHGGRTPTASDGYPDDWYIPGKSRLCTYPLEQDAAGLWYHDHAMGLNRLNIYAGLIGTLLLRDEAEDALDLPRGAYEVPLTLYDRNFTAEGQLFYPTSGDPDHPWVSEFYADAILINGKIRPYLQVEPRLYRFRVLNAANSRFFQLALTGHQPMHQIGSDQGLMSAPVTLTTLSLAPAERADLLIDFSQAAGQHLHLLNGALEVMEFRVAKRTDGPASLPQTIPATLRPVARIPQADSVLTRTITLNEYVSLVGNSMLMTLNYKRWHEPVTEQPKLDSTEIWEFVNLTEDTHPMHLHLVRFQVLDRRIFDVFAYRNKGGLHYQQAAIAPEANEMGWKDTVQCPPGMVTRIIARFDGYPGRYLYHCHILEHESNDMMRPFEVV